MSKMTRFSCVAVVASGLFLSAGIASAQTTNTFCHTFNQNLKIGDTGSEVIALQTALTKEWVSVKLAINGTFDEQTAAAVVAFQEKYASHILTPNGLQNGTGYVGPSTRAKLNQMSGCHIVGGPDPIPGCPAGALFSSLTGQSCTAKPASTVPGCASGAAYSSLIGQSCAAPVYPVGCTSYTGYSSKTGQACDGTTQPTPSYLKGCSSYSGYSSVTGAACSVSKQLTITTASALPNARAGQPYSVAINTSGGPGASYGYKWSVNNGAASFPVTGLGISSSYGNPINIVGTPADVYIAGVKSLLPYTFTFSLKVVNGSQTATKTFTLTVDPATPTSQTPTISSINTATGAAPRTGRNADGIGDTLDVFGTNFTSNAGISIDGNAENYRSLARFVSPTLINFVVPGNLSVGSHRIEVYVPISTGGALVSNAVTINVVAQP